MTPSEARAYNRLAPPLKFGNPEQIEAAEFLSALDECRKFLSVAEKAGYELTERCPCCHGRGYSRCLECNQEGSCHECDGDGKLEIDSDDCTTSAQAKALLRKLRGKFPEVQL